MLGGESCGLEHLPREQTDPHLPLPSPSQPPHCPPSTSGPPAPSHPGASIPAIPVPQGPGDRAGFLSKLKPDRALSKAKDRDEMPHSGDAPGSSPPRSSRTARCSSTTSGRGAGSSTGQSRRRTGKVTLTVNTAWSFPPLVSSPSARTPCLAPRGVCPRSSWGPWAEQGAAAAACGRPQAIGCTIAFDLLPQKVLGANWTPPAGSGLHGRCQVATLWILTSLEFAPQGEHASP